MSSSIAGKCAIVTGAGRGIGLAIANHFAERGARVMYADADEARLIDELGEDLAEDSPVRWFAGDLNEKLTAANLLSATVSAFDRVDILVNTSRQIVHSDPLDPDDAAVDRLLRNNFLAPLRLMQNVARRMILQADREESEEGPVGTIVNVASILPGRVHPGLLAYSVAGAALDQATRTMAVALAQHRIRVNGVAVASVMSASLQSALKENPGWRDCLTGATPAGRIAAPSDVAETVQYLASDASAFVTGQVLCVDGGRGLLDPARVPAY